MARIVAFVPDLLFGSNVAGALQAAGHEVQLVSALSPDTDADLVVVDLTAEPAARIAAAEQALKPETPKLAFYSHVEADVRTQAEEAGFDLVVPRSRMAREGAALVDRLLAG
jgi:nucleoside-diphosphate-sugar epimerase